MTTPVTTAPTPALPGPRPHPRHESASGVSFGRVLKSEWIKITSVPSTVILILITTVVMIGLAALLAWQTTLSLNVEGDPEMAAQMQGPSDAASAALGIPGSGLAFGQLLMASLAVVLVASEWGTGMIRSTMVVVPRRSLALLAKQSVMAGISFVVGAGSALIGYFVAQPILNSADLGFALSEDGALLHIVNTGLVLALVSIFAMSIGTLIRNTAGGVVTSIGVLLVLPILFTVFGMGTEWVADAGRFLPSAGGDQMVATTIAEGAFTQWQGALILGGWSLLLLAASLLVTKKRDV
ncbi:ABC transporter permease [Arthrobacter sp. MSA 4-2]|uniref:ABC transporter permease n=1 Tax=Arthrobacter sp. MSA 4-2 TaxID=2794349 RepID=UPI0018E79A59|nr:ABC transporter permease [Arthrobacter sp. MSA 4-2]MBJ2122565.1 ABC transporter permease [Arthrobacter sp. MSA 4-2]